MELNAQNSMNILNKNFDFKIINDDVIGPVLLMPPKEAYLYTAVAGSFYLNDPNFQFRPRGLYPLFYHANAYNLVTGLMTFDKNKLSFFNSPLIHKEKYPFIVTGQKYVIFKDIKNSSDVSHREKLFQTLKKAGKDTSNYILTEIRKDVKGYGMEPFCEYVACKYFSNKGYIVENQIPLFYDVGTPDFSAFLIPEVAESLIADHFMGCGAFLLELASLRVFGKHTTSKINYNYDQDLVVGEAKTCTKKTQIQKYIDTQLYNKCFEIVPDKKLAEKHSGLISFDKSHSLILKDSPKLKIDTKKQKEYTTWLMNYFKYYLLSNLTNTEFLKFLEQKTSKTEWTVKEFTSAVNSLPLREIIKEVDKKLIEC